MAMEVTLVSATVSARPQTTVLEALAGRLEADPDGPYLDFEGVEYTARRMDAESNRLAHTLARLGVGKADRVATLLENRPAQVVTFFAALKLGAVQVPVNTAYKGDFLRHQLADSGSKVIVVQGDFAGRVAPVAGPDLPELDAAIVVGPPDEVIDAVPAHDWDDALATSSDEPVPDAAVLPADLACFIYTAGTTGPSKGCMLPHNYIVALADQIARAWQRRHDDVVITPLPLFHFNAISVCVVGTLVIGGEASIARRFSVSRFWPEVRRTGATIASMLGSLAILIADAEDHPDQQGHHLRLCAAAPMPPDIDRIWNERFGSKTFSAGYGLTEASLISMLPAGESNKPGAAGKPNAVDFEVRLVDDEDVEVPVGEIGEIVCRPTGPNLMFAGYWRRPEETVAVLRNLWFHTGDLGRLDDDGFLYFVDRKKDYLRRRGENISSFEMERTFHGHPAIKDVAVHSVPSEVGEDEVKVTAVLQPDARLEPADLCQWCAERVPYFAIPRYIEFRDDLPRNPVGRVLKYQLRDEGVTETTWDREAAGVTFERR
jgi:carnitine-CoA ligase